MSAQPLTPLLLDSLRSILPADAVRRSVGTDIIDGVLPECVVTPSSEAEMSRVLAYANGAGLSAAPRGRGTKTGWGSSPRELHLTISTAKLDRVLEHAHHDMTASVEAGVSFAEFQHVLAKNGQRVALDPLWPEHATVGGVISTNDSGSLRIRYGSVRDLLIGITVVLADGTIASSGGKVVKNVAGYDLPKLMTGAMGTLGIIIRAVFRLHPLPEQSRTVSIGFRTAADASEFMLAVSDSVLVPTGMQMRSGSGSQTEIDVRFEGIARSVEAQVEALGKLAVAGNLDNNAGEVWRSREELWRESRSAVICKLSMLPNQIGSITDFIMATVAERAAWGLVAQSVGLALLLLDITAPCALVEVIGDLRAKLASGGGSLAVVQCSPALKRELDVWGEPGSAAELTKRIKERFDPKAILNRGRFVGGI